MSTTIIQYANSLEIHKHIIIQSIVYLTQLQSHSFTKSTIEMASKEDLGSMEQKMCNLNRQF